LTNCGWIFYLHILRILLRILLKAVVREMTLCVSGAEQSNNNYFTLVPSNPCLWCTT